MLVLFLPDQLGRHVWPKFAFVLGLRIDYLSPTLYLSDIFIILFIFSRLILSKNIFLNKKLLAFIFLFLAIGIFLAKSPFEGAYSLIKLGEFLSLGFALFDFFKKEKSARLLFYGLGSSVLTEGVIGILELLKQASLNGFFYWLGERNFTAQTPGIANASLNSVLVLRPYATFPHPNVFAGFLFFALILVFLQIKKLTLKEEIFAGLVFFIGSLALFLTLSRVGIFLFLTFVGFLFFKRLISRRIKISLLFIFILFLFFLFFKTELFYRFFFFAPADINDRLHLLNLSFKMFFKNPIFGVGLGNFLPNIVVYDPIFSQKLFIQPVHNVFALILAETGIVGLLFILFLCIKLILFFYKNKNFLSLFIFLSILFWGQFDHFFLTLQQGELISVLTISFILAKRNEI